MFRHFCCVSLALLASGAVQAGPVEIRRTADGIPHIKADNWRDLGQGYGYVQAQDALCTLNEAFVTFNGRRSWYWGQQERPEQDSTFGRVTNLELDIFFKAYADDKVVEAYRREQPQPLQQLIEGFAAGYNRYLAQARAERQDGCASKAWAVDISADDIYRRMVAANYAGGFSHFIPAIVNAAPPAADAKSAKPAEPVRQEPVAARQWRGVGEQAGIGSNAIALGASATGRQEAVLFGNPHWYWSGPDRFYQAHLTIPGKLNVAGVSFLGIPVVMIGFNDHVAWTHTVSEARRFGLFDLTLDGATGYRLDQAVQPMSTRSVTVEVRDAAGKPGTVVRTLYASQFGPLADMGGIDPHLAWGSEHAMAMRDINQDNFRIFRNFFYWNQATSLEDFVAIQRREAAMPWINTLAIGRGDGRVWYGDVGNIPNVPDALRSRCTTPIAQAFAGFDKITPVLDGSRADCNWLADPASAQAGAMPVTQQVGVFRNDYVANMNDSYWLTNAAEPIEGYASVLGGERGMPSMRSKLGHQIAGAVLKDAPLAPEDVASRLRRDTLDARSWAALQYKAPLLDAVCRQQSVLVQGDTLTGKSLPKPRRVPLADACRVLVGWDNHANAHDRGAGLWEQFWARIETIPLDQRFEQPFDPKQPLTTPSGIRAADPRMAQALGGAVLAMRAAGITPDAPRGSYLYAGAGKHKVALYGGCHDAGYFTVACTALGSKGLSADFVGNTYLQLVRFGAQGVQADTLLSQGERETGLSDTAANTGLQRYAAKRWLRFPFAESAIEEQLVSRQVLTD